VKALVLSSKDRNDNGDEEDKINKADEVVTMECRRRRRRRRSAMMMSVYDENEGREWVTVNIRLKFRPQIFRIFRLLVRICPPRISLKFRPLHAEELVFAISRLF
jgi:hypothetical protein